MYWISYHLHPENTECIKQMRPYRKHEEEKNNLKCLGEEKRHVHDLSKFYIG